MFWIIFFILVVSLIANAALTFFLTRFLKRLLQYDDLYQYLVDDIEVNLGQFERIRKSSLLSDDDEVQRAHKSMMVMSARLDEFVNRMEETTGLQLRKVTKPMSPVNVTKAAEDIANERNNV